MPKTRSQTVDRAQYEAALSRTREIVQRALELRSYDTTSHNMAHDGRHIGQPAPTEYDTAAWAYMQGVNDIVLMLKERGHEYADLFRQSA